MTDRGSLAERINACARLRGSFVLRSGQTSDVYFDKYRFESDPALLTEIAGGLETLLPADAEVLAGLELGGVPLATALSLRSGLPVAFVRKQAKTYGTARLAEGASIEGRRVVVVEDVITTGGQVLESVAALRQQGAQIDTVLCVIDRSGDGGAALGASGLALRALLTRAELDAAAG